MKLQEDITRIKEVMGIISEENIPATLTDIEYNIHEGKRIKISNDVLSKIDNIIDKVIPVELQKFDFSSAEKIKNQELYVGWLKYNELGEHVLSDCMVYIVFNKDGNWSGQYHTRDPKNNQDNFILLNLFWTKDFGVNPKNLVQNYQKAKEFYRDVLVHELAHAMDPKINRHVTDVTYKNYNPDTKGDEYMTSYLAHDIEVIAQTTTFFNRLVRLANDMKLKHGDDLETIQMFEDNLDLLLNAFAKYDFSLIDNYDFLSMMEGAIPKKLVSFMEKVAGKIEELVFGSKSMTRKLTSEINNDSFLHDFVFGGKRNSLYGDLTRIFFYKQYNPRAWKEFLTKLYHTVEEAKEILHKDHIAD